MASDKPRNRLVHETSPYLLQHQDNPVHWYAWGEDALAAAKSSGKPILLSIGYSSCHWCHVMAHESFENEDIAALMNDLYINVKVDREERPDLDVIYQSSLALMRQPGGWPLTMFLTPEGEPFWGGTYFPPEERYGRPGFKQVLSGIAGAWADNREQVTSNVEVIRDALDALSASQPGKALDLKMVDDVASSTLRAIDPVLGGFRGAPKFPQVPFLRLLWRGWRRGQLALYFDAVVTTLDHMCQGGIYDHLGGGFARYSTDEQWLVPHFEKMLYDNAQLISLMTDVWKDTKSPLYEARIYETIDWVLEEMKVEHPNGDTFAFASALDADTNGEEGQFYVWTDEQIDEVLTDMAPLFKQTYGVTGHGNWTEAGHGINVLLRRHPFPGEPAVEEMLSHARDILFEARSKRTEPRRDDKVLADLNGLMVRALAEAGTVFGEPDWIEAAETAFAFVSEHMVKDGRLARCWVGTNAGGEARHNAVLDDLAQMGRAAIALYEATGNQMYLAQAEAWVHQAGDLFWCSDDGGYCLSARDVTDVITRTRQSADNAVPSGNGTMADVLARLYLITGEDHFRQRAEDVINAFPAETADAVANMPTLLNAFELLSQGSQVVVAAKNGDGAGLADAVLGAPGSLRVLIRTDEDHPHTKTLAPGHPAHGKTTVDGQAAAYVCRAGTCSAPVVDADALIAVLKGL